MITAGRRRYAEGVYTCTVLTDADLYLCGAEILLASWAECVRR